MSSTTNEVRQRLRGWAADRSLAVDAAGYTLSLDDNLFQPMSAASRSEFEAGDGGELGSADGRGKMQALHSSSALACNVFDYWRTRACAPLSAALGTTAGITDIRFEQKFPTGLRGNAPNLDVVLSLGDGSLIAIESKFLEPYGAHLETGFKTKYLEAKPGLWEARGLHASQRLVDALQGGIVTYRWLYAEQLLKHMLGLATSAKDWSLWYLWYQAPGEAGVEHAREVRDFADRVNNDGVGFRAISYQQLHALQVKRCGPEDRAYLNYLGDRYFGGAGLGQAATPDVFGSADVSA